MSRYFQPYADNGGSVVAIAGEDFCIIGADTRLSEGYSIRSRDTDRIAKVTNLAALAVSGCWCDAITLNQQVKARLQSYSHEHRRPLATPSLAQLLSTMLYSRRFFPMYVSVVLGGIDAKGKGVVYSYDPIGNFDECGFRAGGSSGALMQPLLDSKIGGGNAPEKPPKPDLETAKQLIKDLFISAAERDIYTGDRVKIMIINSEGTSEEYFELRKD